MGETDRRNMTAVIISEENENLYKFCSKLENFYPLYKKKRFSSVKEALTSVIEVPLKMCL